jgi:AmmeMemoRadiSam system protein A
MNSGDSDYGEKNSVVGYVSIIISKKDNMEEQTFKLDDRDKRDLLSIARRTLEYYIPNRELPKIDQTKFSKSLQKNCGAFVTFHKQGNLRGCIGRFDAVEPLFKVVQEMAVASATQDYRFTPVQQNEIKELEIEISVLTPLQRINSADEFILGKHGIYIKKGSRTGTFLPQVATETGWTKEEFLGHCAQDKAGIGWNGWKDSELYVYEAIIFSEKELSGK